MERLRFRSTSAVDLMAELHQRDLLDEARRLGAAAASTGSPPRSPVRPAHLRAPLTNRLTR